MDTKIFVATHKDYAMPPDELYQPIWGGVKISNTYKGQFIGDNTGDNISDKNPCFNELTVLYWIWKNSNADIKGLVHYRRLLGSNKKTKHCQLYDDILNKNECEAFLQKYDVIVSKRRNYYFINIYNHYTKSRANRRKELEQDMIELKNAILKICPAYLEAYNVVMKRTWAHMLNIMVFKKKDFDDYCEWLFPLLFEVEKHLIDYRDDRTRVCGALSEMMLDIYIEKNNMSYVELPLIELEKISFMRKIINKIKCVLK